MSVQVEPGTFEQCLSSILRPETHETLSNIEEHALCLHTLLFTRSMWFWVHILAPVAGALQTPNLEHEEINVVAAIAPKTASFLNSVFKPRNSQPSIENENPPQQPKWAMQTISSIIEESAAYDQTSPQAFILHTSWEVSQLLSALQKITDDVLDILDLPELSQSVVSAQNAEELAQRHFAVARSLVLFAVVFSQLRDKLVYIDCMQTINIMKGDNNDYAVGGFSPFPPSDDSNSLMSSTSEPERPLFNMDDILQNCTDFAEFVPSFDLNTDEDHWFNHESIMDDFDLGLGPSSMALPMDKKLTEDQAQMLFQVAN